jgi:probable HAF family extracellular repeat protein
MTPTHHRVRAGTHRTRSAGRLTAVVLAAALGATAAVPAAATADPDRPAPASHAPLTALDPDVVADITGHDDPYLDTEAPSGFDPVVEGDDAAALDAKLGDADQLALTEAQAAEEDIVTVLLAVEPGTVDEVQEAVARHGGSVGRAEDDLGYVRATVPVDDLPALVAQDDVLAVDLDREVEVPDPAPVDTPAGGAAARAAVTGGPGAPSAKTPTKNPYLPTGETGAADFTRTHRTSDGRGTVIGILDTGVDLAHPALRTTTDGRPKVVGWFTATDPVVDNDATWQRMTTTVTGPSFRYTGTQYTAPAGTYRIAGPLESSSARAEALGDLNRDGDTTDRVAMLYDETTHEVRVDTDADGDFVEETPMLPFDVDGQVGQLGTDDPDTDVVESMPFVVEVREDVDLSPLGGINVGRTADYVNLGVVSGQHGTHVAGIAAGNGLFGGAVQGAAPGAQIVSARACTWNGGCTSVALTEGMIDLVVEHDVDVVNVSIGGLVPLNDGSSAVARLYDELVDTYDVDIVASAGNDGPGLNTVAPPSTGDSVISVAASVSDDTWFANYGARVPTDLALFPFSARGPSEDGSLKPTLAAPGAAVSTTPTWLPGASVPETGYDLPAGYSMLNGTSMAAPQVAGAVAVLRSAAQARGLEVSAEGMRTALMDSADLIDDVQVAEQGAGVVDVAGAWRRIVVDGVLRPGHAEYTVSAPVCSELSGALTTPDHGVGVYDRCLPADGGLAPGERTTYDVDVTRTTGAAGTRLHRLTLVGDDRTFDVPPVVALRRGDTRTVAVQARPRTAGLHSALLRVDDPLTPGVDHVVPLTVVASEVAAAPRRTVVSQGTVPRGSATSMFVAVPEGVQNLQVSLTGSGGKPTSGDVRVRAFDPVGLPVDGPDACYVATATCDPAEHSYERPRAGVWELVVEASRRSGRAEPGYRVEAVLQGVTLEPAAVTLDGLSVHTPEQVTLMATNDWGTLDVRPAEGALGRTVALWSTVADGGVVQNRVDVPRDGTLVDLTITPREDDTDLDVLFVHAATGRLVARGQEVGSVAERVVVRDPMPGSYYLVVQGTSLPGETAAFDYVEKIYSPSIGAVTATDTGSRELRPGASWGLDVDVTGFAHPFGARPLVGAVPLVNPEGAYVGSADVIVSTVTTPQATVLDEDQPFVGTDMNSSGLVVGDDQISSRTTPVTWTAEDGTRALDMGAGRTRGSAYGVNEGGAAAGQVMSAGGTMAAVLWRPDGTLVELGAPDGADYRGSYAYGLNDATQEHGVQVAGMSVRTEQVDGVSRQVTDAWVWTDGSGFRILPHLTGDGRATTAVAINDAGWVVGSSLTDGVRHAVRWSPDGEIEDLGVLPGMFDSSAQAVNAAGDVVGISGDDAFVWTAEDGMRRLPDLGFDGTVTAITDEGWVLGDAQLAPEVATPVVWDPQGRLYDVGRMADGSDVLPAQSLAMHGSEVLVYGFRPSGSGVVLLDLPSLP